MTDQPTKTDDALSQLNNAFAPPAAGQNAVTVPTTSQDILAKADLITLPEEGGGLSYRTAHPDEREFMDKIIAGVDFQNPDGIIAIGEQERTRLGQLADQMLDEMNPGVRLSFAQALKDLIDAVRSNSLDEMKKKVRESIHHGGLGRLKSLFGGSNELTEEQMIEMVQNFSTNISQARKVIREMVDRLELQKVELVKNYARINTLGGEFTDAAQKMRIVRAATAESIRRVASGENKILTDLAASAKQTGRADDLKKLQTAVSSFNVLRDTDAEFLSSIGIFDMNVAAMAFTQEANISDRAQIASALTNSVNRWKMQLAAYSVMMVEVAAQKLIKEAKAIDRQSIKNTVDVLEQLVDMKVELAGSNSETMRTVMEAENKVAGLLEDVGGRVEAKYQQQENDKRLLEQAMSGFRQRMTKVYTVDSMPPPPEPSNPQP